MEAFIHKIDKELAVIKALTEEHNKRMIQDISELKKSVDSLKIKVAVISTTISLLIGGLSVWLK